MKKHKIIEIEGKQHYYCRLDSRNKIIIVDPPNKFLQWKYLRDLFNKFRKVAKFSLFDDDIDPDLVVAEDKYEHLKTKNPELSKLTETFDLEVIS